MFSWIQVTNAAREAAAYAIINPTDQNGILAVNNNDPGVAYYINKESSDLCRSGMMPEATARAVYYHIIGYAGFQLVSVDGAKNIQGILRQIIFPGPITTTAPGFAGAPLAIQLLQ